MIKTTPFHPRLAELNKTSLWSHWSGYLSATKYDMSSKYEYFGVRNAAGLFDSSPMFKYVIEGPDAEKFLSGVMARDVRTCAPGRAQYTVWCDDGGYLLEDGVLFRHSVNEFFLTAAEPNLSYLQNLVGRLDVTVRDVSEDYALLAIQGPRSAPILGALAPDVLELRYFGLTSTKIADTPVTVSRTGYSGDLGYEITIPADRALEVWDAIWEAGQGHGIRPFGDEALGMVRIEAGLPLIHVEFSSSRMAYNDFERFTPDELGLGWLLKGIEDDTRPFIGRRALLRERAEKTSRYSTVGITIDPVAYDALYRTAGLIPEMDHVPVGWETMIYDANGERAGYATSLFYSPMMQRYIGIARVKPHLSAVDTELQIEQSVNHEYVNVRATVTSMPFFNPERKTAMP